MDAEMKGYRTGINDGKERSSGPDWLRYADIIDKQHHVSKKHPLESSCRSHFFLNDFLFLVFSFKPSRRKMSKSIRGIIRTLLE